jgi:transmembrane sensor
MAVFFQRIATLILKNLRDELTPEEHAELHAWVNASPDHEKLFGELTDEDSLRNALQEFYESDETIWNKILKGIQEEPVVPVRRIRIWRYVAAACITILVVAGIAWWFTNKSNDFIAKTPALAVKLEDIVAPTGNNSTLTLSNGTVIILDSTTNGTLAHEGNSSVIKKEGILEYSVSEVANSNSSTEHHILRTARGGQQKLFLPDGSYVLLNAESSISYPASFAGNERKVQITGEAWFEIKSIPREGGSGKMPFIVEIVSSSGENPGQVEVLGTQFAINAYDDKEAIIKTTLQEGSVRMRNKDQQSINLNPGQQVQLSSGGNLTLIRDPDLEVAFAFTKNEFVFHSADVETILRELCRWYPVTVTYPNGKPTEKYRGSFSRSSDLATVLKIFAMSEIKYKLEDGNKLIVTP